MKTRPQAGTDREDTEIRNASSVHTRSSDNRECLFVQMYDVFFGDCFLVKYKSESGKFLHILIDFGTHASVSGTTSIPVSARIREITARIKKECNNMIDILIITRLSQDHVSGFKTEWNGLFVEEIWLPWYASKKHGASYQKAQKNRINEQLKHLDDLSKEHVDRYDIGERKLARYLLENIGVQDRLRNLETWLGSLLTQRKTRSRRRYLPEPTQRTFQLRGFPEVRVRVHSRRSDEAASLGEDATSAENSFRVQEELVRSILGEDRKRPFDPRFSTAWEHIAQNELKTISEDERRDMQRKSIDCAVLGQAQALDRQDANSSLVLSFEIGTARLLFASDAGVSAWERMLDSKEDGEAANVVRGTTFLKVGAHGAQDGTPDCLLKVLPKSGLHAMLPTGNSRLLRPFPEIPSRSVEDDLKARAQHGGEFIRSDAAHDNERENDSEPKLVYSLSLPC